MAEQSTEYAVTPNPILSEALRYYAERRTMGNPKGWAHVQRVVERALVAGVPWDVTEGQVLQARAVLDVLVSDERRSRPEGERS